MILINFGHPIREDTLNEIRQLSQESLDSLINLKTAFEVEEPFEPQIRKLVDNVELSSEDWQTKSILINPPTLSIIALGVMAELHGRMGYFPAIIRLKQVDLPPRFVLAEILNLQTLREGSRKLR